MPLAPGTKLSALRGRRRYSIRLWLLFRCVFHFSDEFEAPLTSGGREELSTTSRAIISPFLSAEVIRGQRIHGWGLDGPSRAEQPRA